MIQMTITRGKALRLFAQAAAKFPWRPCILQAAFEGEVRLFHP